MEEEQSKVEQRSRHRFAIDKDMLFWEMPTARAYKQDRRLIVQRVMPPRLGVVESDCSAHRIAEVHLTFDQVVPGRRIGILEIGHEDIGAAIEGVDHHLAVGRTGDLDAAVLNVARERRDPPVGLTNCAGLGQKIGLPPGIEPLLQFGPAV